MIRARGGRWRVERVVERFVAEIRQPCRQSRRIEHVHPAKAAHVAEAQFAPIIEPPADPVEAGRRIVGIIDGQRTGHAQMDDQCEFVIEVDDEELRPPPHGMNRLAGEGDLPRGLPGQPRRFLGGRDDGDDAAAGQRALQPAPDGFYFG